MTEREVARLNIETCAVVLDGDRREVEASEEYLRKHIKNATGILTHQQIADTINGLECTRVHMTRQRVSQIVNDPRHPNG